MIALLATALSATVLALAVAAASRQWRRHDVVLWHVVWVALAGSSLASPLVSTALPAISIGLLRPDTSTTLGAAFARGTSAIVWVYLAGAIFFAVRLIAGLWLVRRLVRQSDTIDGIAGDVLRRRLGESASRCRVHQRLQVPVTVGWRRPVVLLPATWITWDLERATAVLRHELAHNARGDYAWNFVGAVQQAVYWFNPAAWLIARRLRLSAELACDRAAAQTMGEDAYARVLIETAREASRAGRHSGLLALGALTSLEARVDALLATAEEPQSSRHPSRRSTRVLAAVIVAATLVTGASARVVGSHSSRHAALHLAQHHH